MQQSKLISQLVTTVLYQVQVKTDSQRAYHKLSIKMRSSEALKGLLTDLIVQYAQDNQLNYHTVSAQIVDENKQVVHTHLSNAQANKGV